MKQKQKLFIKSNESVIEKVQPAILFPKPMYTGKQVVSVMLKYLCQGLKINLDGKTQMAASTWGVHATESKTIIRNSELLTGLIDKKHIGAQANGLTHCINELIGGEAAGCFITAYGKVCAYLLQKKGFTCSLEDMQLVNSAEEARNRVYK